MKQPTKGAIINAYNIANESGAYSICKVLKALYPNVDFSQKDNRPVTEKIKTLDDAIAELGEDNPLVRRYSVFIDGDEADDWNAMHNANELFKEVQTTCGCSVKDAANIIAKAFGKALTNRKQRKKK